MVFFSYYSCNVLSLKLCQNKTKNFFLESKYPPPGSLWRLSQEAPEQPWCYRHCFSLLRAPTGEEPRSFLVQCPGVAQGQEQDSGGQSLVPDLLGSKGDKDACAAPRENFITQNCLV